MTARTIHVDDAKWMRLRMRAFLDPALSTSSALVNVAIDEWFERHPDPEPTVSPLRATVERDGSISAIAGGPLEQVVYAGPKEPPAMILTAPGSSFGTSRPAPKGGRKR